MPRAATHFREALALYQQLELADGAAWAHVNLARVALAQGDYAHAAALLEEQLTIFCGLGDEGAVAEVLFDLGRVAQARGDLAGARLRYRESLAKHADSGNKLWVSDCLLALAGVVLDRTDGAMRAARLLGAAMAVRTALNTPLPPMAQSRYDHDIAAMRSLLPNAIFAQRWAEGQAMPLEQAVAEALNAVG